MRWREYGDNRRRIQHMWSVVSRGSTTTVGVDSGSSSANSFFKDGRKIAVGDCALFKPPNDFPPFIGIIHSLSSDKEDNLKLSVNWLYRPAEVVLGKGAALEAAPNEVFYSFHKDETPAASLLHPCKVAFLPRGVELPSGVSSFVCRRVYDITNKCLWWLTEKDYIHDWQGEVDQLLQKSHLEMRAKVQPHQGTQSPKPVNGATATSPLKHSPDNMLNSTTFSPHPKGKKRDLGDQTSEPVKRERLLKDGGDSISLRSESFLKSEITKITEKGGLVDYETVERLLRLMQPEKCPKKLGLSYRSMLAGIIASTDRLDCLNHFVQIQGLPVLDYWLQEVHKGKVGDSNTSKDGDKSVEDFLLVLLRALDKIPVNLKALQTCNIGKSVNNLRSHKNLEIQKKSRSLVDTWKKRVEAEMNINDNKSGSNQPVAWSSRSRHDVPHGGNKHNGGSSDTVVRSSGPFASAKSGSPKPVNGDTATRTAPMPSGNQKASPSLPLMASDHKEGQVKVSSTGGGSELAQTAVNEEKSSSSSQSHANSQCSSDPARNGVPSGKEDGRSSTAGSKSTHKNTVSSRHRKSADAPRGRAHSAAHKDSGSNKNASLPIIPLSENISESTITSENTGAAPVSESNRHKIIVKIPNRGPSPAQVANPVSIGDPFCRNSRATSPAHSEKQDKAHATFREKNSADQNMEADVISAAQPDDGKQHACGNDAAILPDASKTESQSIGNEANVKRSLDSSLNSINALIDSCVKYSETHASIPVAVGDDSGMNLLASVATGEFSRSGAASPAVSPTRNIAMAETASVEKEGATQSNHGAASRQSIKSNDDLPQNEDPVKSNWKLQDFVGDVSVSMSRVYAARDNGEGGTKQILVKTEIVRDGSDDLASGTEQIAKSSLAAKDEVKDKTQNELMNEDQEHSMMSPSSNYDDKNNPDHGLKSDAPLEHEPASLPTCPGSPKKEDEHGESSVSHDELAVEHSSKKKAVNTHVVETCVSVQDCADKINKQESNTSSSPCREEGSALASVPSEEKAECKSEHFQHVETEVGSHFSSKECDVIGAHAERNDDNPFSDTNASSIGAVVSETGRRLEFDLNEGFDMDDVKNTEPAVTAFPQSYIPASQSAVSRTSCGLLASVTVASAAKRPFVPPEDLLRNKAELGWKGSASTSAFRPAEPRRLLDNLTDSNKPSFKETSTAKPVRPVLDFDLNVSDEMVPQDIGCHNSEQIDPKPDHKSGGLELDLNKVDDALEMGHLSSGYFQRHEVSVPPIQSSNGIISTEISTKRNFDLNDGPATDESSYNQYGHVKIPPQLTFGARMNNVPVGSLSSYFSPGFTYSSLTNPAAVSDVPIIGAPGPHRVLGGPMTGSSYNTDFYRGAVLATSSAVPFATPPFQYPVFPLGTTFPLPTNSLSGGSAAYMDLSSGGRFYTPTNPTQLVGTAASVSSQYLRPCVVSVPDGSSNGVGESSRKWARHGLDLNSGPVVLDVEGRDELLMASRQLPAVSSQALLDEQTQGYQVAGGVLKRKEPEGGWDTDRRSYKQSSWQ